MILELLLQQQCAGCSLVCMTPLACLSCQRWRCWCCWLVVQRKVHKSLSAGSGGMLNLSGVDDGSATPGTPTPRVDVWVDAWLERSGRMTVYGDVILYFSDSEIAEFAASFNSTMVSELFTICETDAFYRPVRRPWVYRCAASHEVTVPCTPVVNVDREPCSSRELLLLLLLLLLCDRLLCSYGGTALVLVLHFQPLLH